MSMEDGWISVEERVPLDYSYVLACGVDFRPSRIEVAVYYVSSGRWLCIDEKLTPGEVTHWMPFPPGPTSHEAGR